MAVDTIDLIIEKLSKVYEQCVECPPYRARESKQHYFRDVMSGSLGYAGTEIIRKVVGDPKVMEVVSIKGIDKRVAFKCTLLKMGVWLIRSRKVVHEKAEVSEQLNMTYS